LINQIFKAIGLGAITRAWLGDFHWALPAVGYRDLVCWILHRLLLTGMGSGSIPL